MEVGQAKKPLLVTEETGDGNGVEVNGSDHEGGVAGGTTVLFFSTLLVVCGTYVFGTAVGYSSPAEAGITEDLGLSSAEYSVFSSILTIGGVLGAALSGSVADLVGRRGAIWFAEIFCILGWLAILFSKVAFWLDLGRLLLGCGIGIISYAVPVYIAEIAPKNQRGRLTELGQLMIGCGQSVTFFLGIFVNWRTLALIGTVPCVVQFLGIFFIPESPRWLAKCGKKEYIANLQRFRGENVDVSQEAADIKDYTEKLQLLSETKFSDLFQWKYAHSLLVGVGLMVLQQIGGLTAFTFYASFILESAGFQSEIGAIAVAVVQIPTLALSVLLMDRCGRRPLLMASAVGMCLGSLFTGLAFFLQDVHQWKQVSPIFAFIGVLVYLASFALGMAGIPWVIMSEIYPITIKASAGSLVTLVNWFCSWVVADTFYFLYAWSSAGTFFIFSGICGSAVVFVAKLVPETKRQTLEEIQASITFTSTELAKKQTDAA